MSAGHTNSSGSSFSTNACVNCFTLMYCLNWYPLTGGTRKPMKHKRSSRIVGNLALWVALIVATFAVVILANHLVPVSAGDHFIG